MSAFPGNQPPMHFMTKLPTAANLQQVKPPPSMVHPASQQNHHVTPHGVHANGVIQTTQSRLAQATPNHAFLLSQLDPLPTIAGLPPASNAPPSQASTTSAAAPRKHSKSKARPPLPPAESSQKAHVEMFFNLNNIEVTTDCQYCNYSTDRKDRMKRHIRTVHFKDKPFVCGICNQAFGRKDKMTRHERTVHGTDHHLKCDYCDETFARKDKMMSHINKVHLGLPAKGHKVSKAKKTEAAAPEIQQQIKTEMVTISPVPISLACLQPLPPNMVIAAGAAVNNMAFPQHQMQMKATGHS